MLTMWSKEHLKKTRGIYAIACIANNKLYIGSTARNFYDRLCSHKAALRRGRSSSIHLQRAYDKYGEHKFQFIILEELDDISSLSKRELYCIEKFKSCDRKFGFNISKKTDAHRLGHTQSNSTRKKISRSLSGIKRSEAFKDILRNRKGTAHPSYGKKQSNKHIISRVQNNLKKVKRSDGVIYTSMKEAAHQNKCLPQSISQSVRKGYRANGFYFYEVIP